MNLDPSSPRPPRTGHAYAPHSLPVIQQLFFAHIPILEGAPLRLMPTAKLIGRNPAGRVGEFLLVKPLQRIGVGLIAASASRQRQAELQLDDMRAQVEQDVRLALLTLATAAEQVQAAEQSFALAERELRMARDRFAAGVADNIEVVNAQTSLADARDAQTAALTAYNSARINLAFALGEIESFRW